jgi:hypothetical protein
MEIVDLSLVDSNPEVMRTNLRHWPRLYGGKLFLLNMKTIRLEEPGRLALFSTEGPSASIQPDEALVRVHRIGVCVTDIHAFNGRQPFFSYPQILGHELDVEVVAVGSSTKNAKVCAVTKVNLSSFFTPTAGEWTFINKRFTSLLGIVT